MKNKITLKKIIKYSTAVIDYTNEMGYDDFINDKKTIEACVFNLSQIGELVTIIDDRILSKYSNIPWREMKNLRNRIVHDYEGIKFDIIWRLIKNNIPQLIDDINIILKNEKW